MRGTLIRGAVALAFAAGIATTAAAVPAMAAPTACPAGDICTSPAGGQTFITANVSDSFVVAGFPTAVDFAAVAPGAKTAGTASVYAVTTNHASGYTVQVAIDPADEAQTDGLLTRCGNVAGAQDDVMTQAAPSCAFIPLFTQITSTGFLTVQHATTGGTTLGAVQTLGKDSGSGGVPVTIVKTTGPDDGTTPYGDIFTLQIPPGTQASGSYSAVLDYTLAEN